MDKAEINRREDELRQSMAEYQRRLQKYQQELVGGYNARLSKHQTEVQNHANVVQALSR